MKTFWLGFLLLACSYAPAQMIRVRGIKFPNSFTEGAQPVTSEAWSLPTGAPYPGFAELIPNAFRSPHQEEAGSCLYMSLTGIAEWWLSRLNPHLSTQPEGPLDLSERYVMNLAGVQEDGNGVRNWKTDSIYILNHAGAIPRNVDYRFTKGWVARDKRGEYVKATQDKPGAVYNTKYNWINEMNLAVGKPMVRLPTFKREVLFADPASDQWNVAVTPPDIVERIKAALRSRQAPVHVIYNHYGYWHAVSILGYDDDADSKNCAFVVKFLEHMKLRKPKIYQKAEAAFKKSGCEPKGMFYVRDSLYSEAGGPIYDYDLTRQGEELPYSRRIVLHEYDWIRIMANHVTQIIVE